MQKAFPRRYGIIAVKRTLFPKGIDIILTSNKQLSALPRTTKIKMIKTEKG